MPGETSVRAWVRGGGGASAVAATDSVELNCDLNQEGKVYQYQVKSG